VDVVLFYIHVRQDDGGNNGDDNLIVGVLSVDQFDSCGTKEVIVVVMLVRAMMEASMALLGWMDRCS
jgi:hypothetical protein